MFVTFWKGSFTASRSKFIFKTALIFLLIHLSVLFVYPLLSFQNSSSSLNLSKRTLNFTKPALVDEKGLPKKFAQGPLNVKSPLSSKALLSTVRKTAKKLFSPTVIWDFYYEPFLIIALHFSPYKSCSIATWKLILESFRKSNIYVTF